MTRWLGLLVAFVASAATLGLPMGARATLVGDTVNCSVVGSLTCAPPSAVVTSPAAEFALLLGDPVIGVNVEATTVLLTDTVAVALGAGSTVVSFTSLGDTSQGAVIGATLTSSDVATFTQSDVSFTSDSLSLDLTGTTWFQGQSAQITLLFANEPGPGQGVPEPSTLLLLGAGLFGLGLNRYRRKA